MKICHNCGEPGHHSRGCKEPKPTCQVCGNQHLTIFHAAMQIRNRENLEREKQKTGQSQNRPLTQNNQIQQQSKPNPSNNTQNRPPLTANAAATHTVNTQQVPLTNNPVRQSPSTQSAGQQAQPAPNSGPPTNGAPEL